MPTRRRLVGTATAWAALALGFVVAAFSLPIDDFWLSLASARALAHGADPSRAIDLTWLPTLPGAINPQWVAQLLFAAPGTMWGALAVNGALLSLGLIVTAVRTRRRAGATASAVAMLLVLGVLAPHLLAQAQSFSIALVPMALLLLDRRPPSRWLPLVYGVLMVVWANLHGAFVIGQVAALTTLAGEVVRWRRGRPAYPAVMGLTAGVSLIAPLLNPAGFSLLAYAYRQPGLDVIRSISIAWQPAWPWIPVAAIFWAYLALLVAGRIIRRGGVAFGEGLLVFLLALFAAYSLRQVVWVPLVTAPLLASDIDLLLSARQGLAGVVGRVGGRLGDRRALPILGLAMLLVVAVQPIRVWLPEPIGRVTLNEPVAAAEYLRDALPARARTRILNEQVWGGYLSYRLGEQVETAMDGRIEIRDRATWARYFALMHGDGDPAGDLAAAGVAWAALAPDRVVLIAKLEEAGWAVELETADQVLLHRR